MFEQRSIGRDTELTRLERGMREAVEGRGGLWLLTGEPGIGKTRLCEDSARSARQAGSVCAWGRCWESGGAPAFWPWAQVARTLERALGTPADHGLSPAVRAALLPESQPKPHETAADRFGLFDAIATWLARVSESQPLWICIEDLHAADVESLALLEALAVSLRATRVFMVATLRDAALVAGPHVAVHQRIARQANLLALARLDAGAARQLLLSDLESPPPSFVNAALQACDGHPLFLIELVRLTRLAGPAVTPEELVPASIQSVLRQRLERLSSQSLDVLALAALMGMDLDRELLAELEPEAHVDQAIAEGMRDSLLRQLARRSWRFSHAMLRDVLAETLDPGAQLEAHHQIAKVLMTRGATPAAVAHHLHRAGAQRLDGACQASLQAAQDSLDRFAFEDALGHIDTARARLSRDGYLELQARLGVLEGYALLGLGRIEQGRSACLSAAELARGEGSAELFAQAALAYGSVFQFASVDPLLVGLLETALELLGPGDSGLTAQVLARLAAARQPDPVPARPIALAREALAMAERVGDVDVRVRALRSASSALVDLAHPAERRELDQAHLELALQLNLGTDELRARQRLAFDCMELGDFATAQAHLDRARALAEKGADPRYRWLVPALQALRRLWHGTLEGTRELIEEARTLGEDAGDGNARLAHAFQLARYIELSGEEEEATAVARSLASSMSGTAAGAWLSALAAGRFLLDIGRIEQGAAAIDRVTAEQLLEIGDRTSRYGIARWAAAVRQADLGRTLLARCADQADLFVSDGVLGLCWRGPMSLVLAYAAEAAGDLGRALDWSAAAATASERVGALPIAAESQVLCARLATSLGRAEAARGHRARAQALTEGLGLRGVARRLEQSESLTRAPAGSVPGALTPVPAPQPVHESVPVFSAEGDVVSIHWRGRSVRVKATKGVTVLGTLVSRPGVAVHVLDLIHAGQAHAPVDQGDAGDLLDAEARASYRTRVAELREEISAAEANADLGRLQALRSELEFVAHELSRGSSLGQKPRRAPAAEERARQAIRKQIRTSLDHLGELYPELARYLERAIQTGRTCQFDP